MNLSAVLVTGLFAGGVSCAAVQGGLLAGLVTRQREGRNAPDAAAGPKTSGSGSADGTASQRSLRARRADDFTPVGSFLLGKLISHTLLGALLGAVGGAVQLSVPMRAIAQTLAGALVVVFGLAQLGVPGFRDLVIEPPASWSRFVRGRARSNSAFAPGLLGLATVLIPCGVTLSVEALALTSGSAWAGAATMAVFVVGTSPLFAALGFAARAAATAWRGRLAVVTGVIVLAMGLYTFNGGLELAGSPIAASRIVEALGAGPEPVRSTAAPDADGDSENEFVTVAGGKQTVVIRAKTGRYIPENLEVRSGLPTTLVVRSEDAEGCVRSFVIPARNKQVVLPTNGDTNIELGTLEAGRLDYSCGMGMYTGALTIR